jgi:hypothetical protein
MARQDPDSEAVQTCEQPTLLELLALGPVREAILGRLRYASRKAMRGVCKALCKEASPAVAIGGRCGALVSARCSASS